MAREVTEVDAELLASWPLPEAGGSKRARGDVVVIGGARGTPGAAQLAGLSALRVGGGRLTLAVAASVATAVSVAVPESGVLALEETPDGHVRGGSVLPFAEQIRQTDGLLAGPGLDDVDEGRRMLWALTDILNGSDDAPGGVVLDAYALGALAGRREPPRLPNLILKPNETEAEVLLGHPLRDLVDDTAALAERYGAVVSCMGMIADPAGTMYHVTDGGPGLGTSGSGDVLVGAIAGLAARGCSPLQAAVWGTQLHASAGRTLAASVAPVGYLASDLSARLTVELGALTRGDRPD